jgi:hypothetical protein
MANKDGKAKECFQELTVDRAIERTYEWGISAEVWSLLLGKGKYSAHKMFYDKPEDLIREKTHICLHFTVGGSDRGDFDWLAGGRYDDYMTTKKTIITFPHLI